MELRLRGRRCVTARVKHQAKHFFYAAGWKKFEPLWDMIIRARQLNHVTPLLERVLSRITRAQIRDTWLDSSLRSPPGTSGEDLVHISDQ